MIEVPTTRPSWRAMVTTPEPVAAWCGGRDAVAAAVSCGRARPTAMPEMIHGPSIWVA